MARSLHDILRRVGWEAAITAHKALEKVDGEHSIMDQLGDWSADNCEYWKARLIRRKYPDTHAPDAEEWSARIEYDASYRFFPLGTSNPVIAAQRALELHRELRTYGWRSVLTRHRSEFTLAVFWHHNPVVCTYTTLHTLPNAESPPSLRAQARGGLRVGIIEPDPSVVPIMRYWMQRQTGVRSVEMFATAGDALLVLGHREVDMLLVNRTLPDVPATTLLKRFKTIYPNIVCFLHGVCEDSDQIFITMSGVPLGYFLQRRQPDSVFAPIYAAIGSEDFSPSKITSRVRDYFGSCFDVTPKPKEHAWLDQLTGREQEILNCLSKGYSDKEISHILNISAWTVHNHIKHIYEKLNVHTRTEAVIKALQK